AIDHDGILDIDYIPLAISPRHDFVEPSDGFDMTNSNGSHNDDVSIEQFHPVVLVEEAGFAELLIFLGGPAVSLCGGDAAHHHTMSDSGSSCKPCRPYSAGFFPFGAGATGVNFGKASRLFSQPESVPGFTLERVTSSISTVPPRVPAKPRPAAPAGGGF